MSVKLFNTCIMKFVMKVINKSTAMVLILISICVALGIYIHMISISRAQRLKELDKLYEEKLFAESNQEDMRYMINKVKEISRNKQKVKYIKSIITAINDRQYINYEIKTNNSALSKALERLKNVTNVDLHTVLVIQVHGNYRYLRVLLESLRRVVGIAESLLIFAHDYYDSRVYNAIHKVHFARVMQVFYPYSIQLHPYRYPGEDLKFCEELNKCINSNERDPIETQAKLFWWWIVNQVFDHIEVLKNYDGYIYFLETEQYLTTDFILMAKKLEQVQPRYCPECRILSLAARPPRPAQYWRQNSHIIVGVWGWSKVKYIQSGIGFNRTTWSVIKRLKKEFCYFDDVSWVNSLKYLASKTTQKQFYMLSTEGPRVFPTNNCSGSGNSSTLCDISSTVKDIIQFIKSTSRGLFPFNFTLEFDGMGGIKENGDVEEQGGWDDARDREMCMFIASHGRRVFY